MKTLYIVRHAKSDKDNLKLQDIDRPLNARGYNDAHAMAARLRPAIQTPELIISSPAIRALSTALIFARELGYEASKIIINENIYETGKQEYINAVSQVDNSVNSVMIFGHNSTITSLVNMLSEPFTDNVPTCGVTAISFAVKTWKEAFETKGFMIFHDFPKKEAGLINH